MSVARWDSVVLLGCNVMLWWFEGGEMDATFSRWRR